MDSVQCFYPNVCLPFNIQNYNWHLKTINKFILIIIYLVNMYIMIRHRYILYFTYYKVDYRYLSLISYLHALMLTIILYLHFLCQWLNS